MSKRIYHTPEPCVDLPVGQLLWDAVYKVYYKFDKAGEHTIVLKSQRNEPSYWSLREFEKRMRLVGIDGKPVKQRRLVGAKAFRLADVATVTLL